MSEILPVESSITEKHWRTKEQIAEASGELSPLALHLLVLAGKLQLHDDPDGEPYFDPLDLAALRRAIL